MLKTFVKKQAENNALARLVKYMDFAKRRILMNVIFNSQLTVALLFGCFTVAHLTTKLTGYKSAV